MKNLLFLVASLFVVSSFANDMKDLNKLKVTAQSTNVFNAGDEGIQVKSPASTDPEDQITLRDGFFELWFHLINNHNKSIVITDFVVEAISNGESVLIKEFIPQMHIPDTDGLGDPNQKFFAHIDPAKGTVQAMGGKADGKFYIDSLMKDDVTGTYNHKIKVTLRGFITPVRRATKKDPFEKQTKYFTKTVTFTLR